MDPGEWDLIYSVGVGAGSQPGRGMEETIPQGFRFLPFCDNISLIWQLEGKLCPMEPKAIILLSISLPLSYSTQIKDFSLCPLIMFVQTSGVFSS
jgi:hypothetical protein